MGGRPMIDGGQCKVVSRGKSRLFVQRFLVFLAEDHRSVTDEEVVVQPVRQSVYLVIPESCSVWKTSVIASVFKKGLAFLLEKYLKQGCMGFFGQGRLDIATQRNHPVVEEENRFSCP